jgi:uncharacterized protein YgiM (DUF1202 family)
MKKVIVTILVFLSLVAIFLRYGLQPLINYLNLQPKAGIQIESNSKSEVIINGEAVGETPYQNENLNVGEFLVELKPDQQDASASAYTPWKGYVKLNPGTLTVVNRELTATQAGSSGEVITLEKGTGATIISTPTEAEVFIDGQSRGRTPIALSDLASGEHQFLISKENYLKRNIRATIVGNYTLNIAVDLAIAEADLSKAPTVPQSSTSVVLVKQTPTGFLRVRSDATTNAEEIARVNPGEALSLLEERPGWFKVRLKDGREGFVSATYTTKQDQQVQ